MDTLIQKFKDKGLKKIVNVYQFHYTNGKANGLGDFLRGCLCLLQISTIIGLEFDVDFENHPISKFLMENKEKYNIKYNEIAWYTNPNDVHLGRKIKEDDFIIFFKDSTNYLNNINIYDENIYTMFLSFPLNPKISNKHKNIMREKLEPNDNMKNNIALRFFKLDLIEKQYSIIHIRCGDDYLYSQGSIINQGYLNKIYSIINKSISVDKSKILLLSDNNALKILLKSKYPNLIVQLKKITHLGCDNNSSDSDIMYTMLDFYMIRSASKIIAITRYPQGSGFSKWCSVIYDVPYISIIVK
jgi:hypothetical protein